MKTFNITAKVYDLCSCNPKQSLLINEVIESSNSELAKDTFKINMLVDDIIVDTIFSVEEITL